MIEIPWQCIDYWAERYQTLIAGAVALAAAFAAYGVARYSRKNELEDEAKRAKDEEIRTLRSCLLEMDGMIRGAAVYKHAIEGNEPAREVKSEEFDRPAWLTQTASTLPTALGFMIQRVYLFYQEADLAFRNWKDTKKDDWRDACRRRLIQADVCELCLVNAIQQLEDGKEVGSTLSPGRNKSDFCAEYWNLSLNDFEGIQSGLGGPQWDLTNLREAIEARTASEE